MAVYRSARGRLVDPNKLFEEEIAVTPAGPNRNRRGDILGKGGKVEVPVEKINEQIKVIKSQQKVPVTQNREQMKKLSQVQRLQKKSREIAEALIEKLELDNKGEKIVTHEDDHIVEEDGNNSVKKGSRKKKE